MKFSGASLTIELKFTHFCSFLHLNFSIQGNFTFGTLNGAALQKFEFLVCRWSAF